MILIIPTLILFAALELIAQRKEKKIFKELVEKLQNEIDQHNKSYMKNQSVPQLSLTAEEAIRACLRIMQNYYV